jgi:hypothetical protein
MAEEVSNVKPNKATLEIVDYKAQMQDFFIKVKCLNGSTLNPKSKFTIKHVTEANIEEVFGKVAKCKTTNIHLHVDTKKKLFHLCSQIYGMSIITNKKFMSWVIKGYIV